MEFWWVNHKQTFRHEFHGGYLWSPKTKRNGARNRFYDFMRLVRPGDLVFSYANGLIQGIGIARSHCYTCPQPDEFGHVGEAWDKIGWRVDVRFNPVDRKIRPRDFLDRIRRFLGTPMSPLQLSGNGRQDVYLTTLHPSFAEVLIDLIGLDARLIREAAVGETGGELIEMDLPGLDEWERIEERRIEGADVPETVRLALIKARIGQGRFKENVSRFEHRCRITGVSNPVHLVASHIKPWREANNEERLQAANGLLLTPTIDHLFDRGFISFDDSGETLISPVADGDSLRRLGVNPEHPPDAGRFNTDQRYFLEHHRKSVFLQGVD